MIKILKFESDSCPQCKALSATLERITKEYKTDMRRFRGISPHAKNLFLIFNLWYAHTINL